jgi:hypothetical protein
LPPTQKSRDKDGFCGKKVLLAGMTPGKFDESFRVALGANVTPFDYQCRLACGESSKRST